MKRYKCISSDYIFFKEGIVYDESYSYAPNSGKVSKYVETYPEDWEEVFEVTLEDKVSELKKLAKSQGFDCDVVLKELPKKIEVSEEVVEVLENWINKRLKYEQYAKLKGETSMEKTRFLVDQLETFLNKSI